MNIIKLLQERKKATEDAMDADEYETPEQKKERLAKAVQKSSGTYRNQ